HQAGHRAVGAAAAGIVDLLVVVGAGATPLAEAAREHPRLAGRVLQASDALAALALLRPLLEAGDVVLLKGSRGIALEVIVDALAAEAGA
ncbi:MAG: UDP-N-acetylmuramoyl-tripeptide--D-alanyl-D-alanine ligase, partial [Candidatus Limnocylindrales bacterium]